MVLLKGQLEPTVVHRTQFKSRPSVISIDKGVIEITPEASPSTSPESSTNSGKSSLPRPGESTGKTSLDSKFSSKSKVISQHSSENKKVVSKQTAGEGGSNENNLAPIAEVESVETPEPVPSELSCSSDSTVIFLIHEAAVVTVEKAASAKVFFECHYNALTSDQLTPRSLRRRQLEGLLYQDATLSQAEKDGRRQAWAKDETDHLRETRVMKTRSGNVLEEKHTLASKYEVIKVLGKGSFGVVRLVRERSESR
jgi:protein-serine/threonine kinase